MNIFIIDFRNLLVGMWTRKWLACLEYQRNRKASKMLAVNVLLEFTNWPHTQNMYFLPHPRRQQRPRTMEPMEQPPRNHRDCRTGERPQVPQEHLILISFAPTPWPTTCPRERPFRKRNRVWGVDRDAANGGSRLGKSVPRLSGRNTQKHGDFGVGWVNSLGASFLWAN